MNESRKHRPGTLGPLNALIDFQEAGFNCVCLCHAVAEQGAYGIDDSDDVAIALFAMLPAKRQEVFAR